MTSNVEDEPVLTNEPLLTNERVVGGVKDELGSITVSDIWSPPPPFIFVPPSPCWSFSIGRNCRSEWESSIILLH